MYCMREVIIDAALTYVVLHDKERHDPIIEGFALRVASWYA